MLVRNLDYLSIPKEFKKVETNIYDNKSIALVFLSIAHEPPFIQRL